jgi:hypothetical protein
MGHHISLHDFMTTLAFIGAIALPIGVLIFCGSLGGPANPDKPATRRMGLLMLLTGVITLAPSGLYFFAWTS